MNRTTQGPPDMDTTSDIMDLAARLDGTVPEDRRDRQDRALAERDDARHELMAAAHLVDAVQARPLAAPAELIRQAIAPTPAAPVRRRVRLAPWLWLGGAVLASVLAALVLLRQTAPAPDGGAPVTATPAAPAPRMLPTGNADTVPERR